MKNIKSSSIIRNLAINYNRIADHFSATRQQSWSEFSLVEKYLQPHQVVLDYGCGNGRLLEYLKPYHPQYYGVDISEKLIAHAQNEYNDLIKQGTVNFHVTSTKEKKFNNSFFDLVFMIASFHHLANEKLRLKLLQNIYSQLKPGGRLMITVWNIKSDWMQKKKKCELVGDNDYLIAWKNQQGKIITKLYYHHFTLEELQSLLIQSGFKIDQIGYWDGQDFTTDIKKARNLVALAFK